MLRGGLVILAVGVLLLGSACAPQQEAPPEPEAEAPAVEEAPAPEPEAMMARATLQPRADSAVAGSVTFAQVGDVVTIVAQVEGASPGPHGFHIHESGDCSAEDFTSAGGHFNPADVPHGGPSDAERHAGDLGNIDIGEDGSGRLELTSDIITIAEGPNAVLGRGVILHEKADDLVSQPTGAAGGRIACGVIQLGGGEAEESESGGEGSEGEG